MARRDDTPRDLLLGLLALQIGLIDQDQLVAAFGAWSRAKGKTLSEILFERGTIDAESRSLLAAMAEKQLKLHGGDTEKSLAAVAAGPSTREKLAALGDTDLTASVARVGSNAPGQDATATMSVGTATSDGQRFRVLRPHAQGGLGAVFVALDGELNREVALKQILDHHADDPASRTRFLIEAEITGGLEHPGIVPVYGLGHHADGRPYYAMRFIRGDSLKEAVAAFHADGSLKVAPGKRSLALRKLLRRFVDVCNAIDYAHGRGVLHRDLKPGNVIVGKHGETLVVDWGLAKPMGHAEVGGQSDERTLMPSSSSGSAETLPGSAIGTPSYMSPEQAAGDLEHLGPRSDVYSLGATLYCLLTGKAPFEGDDLGAILRDVRKGIFPPPRQVAPSIDPALEAVCLKAMALKPEDRHATARALADDVDRWAADEPVSAYRDPVHVRLARWARRHRTGVAIGAGVLQTAVVVLAVSTALLGQSRARIERERSRAEAVNNFLIKDLLSQADPENNPVGDRITVRELLDKAAAAVDTSPSLKGREDVEGAIRSTIGNTFYGLGLYQPSERHLARAVECQEKAAAVVPAVDRIYTKSRYLWTLYKEHKYDGLAERFQETLAESTRALGPEHEETIYASDSLAAFHVSMGSATNGLSIYRENLEIQRKLHGPEHKLTLVAAGNLAAALLNVYGTGTDPRERKFVAEAETLAHSNRAAAIRGLGPDSPEALYNATYEGRAMVFRGKYAEAAALLGPLRDRFVRVLGPDTLDTAAALWQLGLSEEGLGNLDVAEPMIRKAYEVRRDKLGPKIFMTHEVLASLIRVEYALGKLGEAARLARVLIANPTSERGPAVAAKLPSVEALIAALAGEGDPDAVMTALNRLRKATGSAIRKDDWMGAHLSCLLLECLYRVGKPPETQDAFQILIKVLESNSSTPPRILAEDRARADRPKGARPAPRAEAPVEGQP